MFRRTGTKVITTLLTTVLTALSMVVCIPTAQATGSDFPALAFMHVMSSPQYSSTITGAVKPGVPQSFDCYIIGQSVSGNAMWGHLSSGLGYVPSHYVDTGLATLATAGLPECGKQETSTDPQMPMMADLNIQEGPSYNWAPTGTVSKGSLQAFDCYVTDGEPVENNPTWLRLKNGGGYLPDRYVSHLGTVIDTGLPVCQTAYPRYPSVGTHRMTTTTSVRSLPWLLLTTDHYVEVGSKQSFSCYVTGQPVGGHGLWGRLNNGRGWIPAAYLDGDITSGLQQCVGE